MISKFFINRPIVAMVISLVMIIVVVAMVTLPISQFPEIIPPEVQARAVYPGGRPHHDGVRRHSHRESHDRRTT